MEPRGSQRREAYRSFKKPALIPGWEARSTARPRPGLQPPLRLLDGRSARREEGEEEEEEWEEEGAAGAEERNH